MIAKDYLRSLKEIISFTVPSKAIQHAIWRLFRGESRDAFLAALKLDSATLARGRGWALWKALCWAFPGEKRVDWRVVDEVLADHRREYSS